MLNASLHGMWEPSPVPPALLQGPSSHISRFSCLASPTTNNKCISIIGILLGMNWRLLEQAVTGYDIKWHHLFKRWGSKLTCMSQVLFISRPHVIIATACVFAHRFFCRESFDAFEYKVRVLSNILIPSWLHWLPYSWLEKWRNIQRGWRAFLRDLLHLIQGSRVIPSNPNEKKSLIWRW